MACPFSLILFAALAAGLGRALQESRKRESGKDRAAEQRGRLGAREIVQAAQQLVDAALAHRSCEAFQSRRRVFDESGGLGQLPLDLMRGSMHGTRHTIDLIRSGVFLPLGNFASALLDASRGGVERALCVIGGRCGLLPPRAVVAVLLTPVLHCTNSLSRLARGSVGLSGDPLVNCGEGPGGSRCSLGVATSSLMDGPSPVPRTRLSRFTLLMGR